MSSTQKSSVHYASTIDSFAINHLESLGWQKGNSLGKRNNGISKHISVRKRTQHAGIGADRLVTLNVGNHWWERVYDDLLDDSKDHSSSKNKHNQQHNEYTMKHEPHKQSTLSKADRVMNTSMKTIMYTSMKFVHATGRYGNKPSSESSSESTKKRKRDTKESKAERKQRKKKQKLEKKLAKKRAARGADSDSDDNQELMDKFRSKSSSVLSEDFFKECNGATLKKYRQVGKQNRLKAQEEKLLRELRGLS